MKIATTTADFDQYTYGPSHISQAMTMLAECGFQHIDLSMYSTVANSAPLCRDDWEKWVDEVGSDAARLGLDFAQAHSTDSIYTPGEERDARTALIKRQIEVCRRLHIPAMVVHALSTPGGSREDFMQKNTEFYRDLLDVAEKADVVICTENTCVTNAPTYHLVCAADYHELKECVGSHPLFGCCWDVGHGHVQGLNQYDEITALGKELKMIHIHDNFSHCNTKSFMDLHLQPFTGTLSFDAVIKGLLDAGFGGFFTLEAHSLPVPSGKRAFEKDGAVYDKLTTLPLNFKLRSERLMYDIARHMLETYNCFEP